MRFFFPVCFLPVLPPAPGARCPLQPGASSPGKDPGRLGRTGLRWLSTARGTQALGAPKSQTGQALRCRSGRASRSPQRAGPRVAPGRRSGLRLASCGGAGAARVPGAPHGDCGGGAGTGAARRGTGRPRRGWASAPRPAAAPRLGSPPPVPRGCPLGGRRAPGGLQPLSWGLGGPERASGAPPPAGLRGAGLPGPPDLSSCRGF